MYSLVPKAIRVRFAIVGIILLCIHLSLFQLHSPASQFNHSVTDIYGKQVDWTRFAYIQYVTNTEYLCNSVMLFETLHRLGARANKLLRYLSHFSVATDDDSTEVRLLRHARDVYGANLKPIHVQKRKGADGSLRELLN